MIWNISIAYAYQPFSYSFSSVLKTYLWGRLLGGFRSLQTSCRDPGTPYEGTVFWYSFGFFCHRSYTNTGHAGVHCLFPSYLFPSSLLIPSSFLILSFLLIPSFFHFSALIPSLWLFPLFLFGFGIVTAHWTMYRSSPVQLLRLSLNCRRHCSKESIRLLQHAIERVERPGGSQEASDGKKNANNNPKQTKTKRTKEGKVISCSVMMQVLKEWW